MPKLTKQEFAIKLLAWLTPYPLSRALPRILHRILAGPAALTPSQWAQATYDALTKFLSDSAAYADTLFDTTADIPPTDQLTTTSGSLTDTIAKLKSLLATLKVIISNLEAYTQDEISDAFSDATAAADDLTSATHALIDAIQQIPPDQQPDIPAPEYIPPEEVPPVPPEPVPEIPVPEYIPPEELPPLPPEPVPEIPVPEPPIPPTPPPAIPPTPPLPPPPLYVPPVPPLYVPAPGAWPSIPLYPPRGKKSRAGWVQRFDNTHWEGYDDSYVWDGTKWVADDSVYSPWLVSIGTWHHGFRPTHIRVTFSPSPGRLQVTDDSAAHYALYTSTTYDSLAEAPLNWDVHDPIGDIGWLWIRYQTWYATIVTNIEFYVA